MASFSWAALERRLGVHSPRMCLLCRIAKQPREQSDQRKNSHAHVKPDERWHS